MTVFTRYLLRAHVGPFLFAFVALTGVILINTLAKELANLAGKGLPMSVVAEFFILSLPANIALTLPMAVLVAVLYTFSTLAADNEITALRASGVDLRRVALPLIGTAAIIAGGMVWFSDQVLPAANYRWRVLMTDVASTRPLLAIREQAINPIPTTDGRTSYYLEAQRVDAESGRMEQVSIYDVSDDRITRTITADSGRMAFDPGQTDLLLTLYDGDVREINFTELANFQVIAFGQQMMRMDGVSDRLERTGESTFRTDRDMTISMMQARIDTLRVELRNLEDPSRALPPSAGGAAAPDTPLVADLEAGLESTVGAAITSEAEEDGGAAEEEAATLRAAEAAPAAAAGEGARVAPPTIEGSDNESIVRAERDRYAEARMMNVRGQIRELQVEIQKKFSIAAATLVFVLLGVPVALRFPRAGIGMVIGVSLAVFGIYYVGLIGGETLGNAGYVPAGIAMWGTNIIFGTLGLFGFLRLGHEQGTSRGGGFELPGWLRRFGRRRASEGGR